MNQKITVFILGIILLISGFLRFYKLTSFPPSLEWDEVATGYDAYSILKTGKDQYGNFLPLTMRSLDDYKPPLYTYLVTSSIAIFGWNDFAVRFPAAFLGTLSVLTTYLMAWQIFKSKKIALLSALFLGVSPWHTHFSRLALETNSTIFFTTFGIWAFFKGLTNGKFLLLTALLFGLDLYLYHNARVFIPVLSVFLFILYIKDLWQQKKYLIGAIVIALIFIIRLIPILTSIEGQMRFQGTSIFSPAMTLELDEMQKQYLNWKEIDDQNESGLLGRIYHSKKVFFGLRILKNYLSNFDPNFWVFTNDSFRHHVWEMGIIYFIDLPFIYLGWYFLFRYQKIKSVILILIWVLLTPIPASVTRDAPHALRTAIFMPTFQILIALGVLGTIDLFKQIIFRKILTIGIILFYIINIIFFMHQYFGHYAVDSSEYWLYGRKETAVFAESVKNNYDKIIVSPLLEQPHMFFLYYLKYDPVKYQKEGGTVSGGWAEEKNKFDKYEFKNFNYLNMRNGKTLFIGLPSIFPQDTNTIKKIKFLNGKDAIWMAD